MAGKPRRSDVDTETALLVTEQERLLEESRRQQQEERERMIAQSYEMAGQIKATRMIAKFGEVTSLMFLKQVKESKIYRDLPNIGTWEEYCKYIGLDRHTTDQALLNLSTFGEQFLEIVTSLRVGYRDLRKLRQLTHEGTLIIDAEAVEIGGERVPLAPEHKEDLQALIERVIDEKDKALNEAQATLKAKDRRLEDKEKEIHKLHKELTKLEDRATAREMTAEEDAFLQRMKGLRMGFDGYMLKADPEAAMSGLTDITPRTRAALISTIHYMKMQVLAAYDTAVMIYGNPAINPEIAEECEAFEQEYEAWTTQQTDEA